MVLTCPHCSSRTLSVGNELFTGSLRALTCSSCGKQSYAKRDLRYAILGLVLFVGLSGLSYAVGGTELVARFPTLFLLTLLALVAYLVYSIASPLDKAP